MTLMAQKPPPESVGDEPEKKGKPISYRPHPKIRPFLVEHINSFEYPPSYSDILDDALSAFLRKAGYKVPDLSAERRLKDAD
jgi:hypothetical protein